MKKIFQLGILLFFAISINAQHDTHYSMFMFNKLTLNPAYAGSKEVMTFTGHYRNQWSGIDGAPQTFTFGAHTPFFKKRCGAGISIIADKIGMVNTYYIDLSYAYRIKLDKKKTLSIGLTGQMEYGRTDWTQSDPLDLGDSMVQGSAVSKLNSNFGVGVYYQEPSFYVGASVPRVFRTTVYSDLPFEDISLRDLRSYYLMGGFVARLSKNLKLQPGVLLTINPNAPLDIDLNTSLVFMDRLWFGLSYRLQDSFDAIIQFQINTQLKAALAVDLTLSELNYFSPGSFELMLEYTLQYNGLRHNNIRYF